MAKRRRRQTRIEIEPPICIFCGKLSGRIGDEPVWRCDRCQASVAFDPMTGDPEGLMSKSPERLARDGALVAFNRIVLDRVMRSDIPREHATQAGRVWLAEQLGLDLASIDFATLGPDTCDRIVRLCDPLWSVNRKATRKEVA